MIEIAGYVYGVVMPLITIGAWWYICQQEKKVRKEKEMNLEINSMVTLTIGDDLWIGQIVEIIDEVALVRLAQNMHYHASLSELTLFTKKHL